MKKISNIRQESPETLLEPLEPLKRRVLGILNGNPERSLVLAVTACKWHEGVTTVTMNLAANLAAEDCGRVLILDGNTGDPSLHPYLRGPGRFGPVREGYMGNWRIHRVDENLDLLFARDRTGRSAACFQSPGLEELLAKAKEIFRYIIIDCPPVLEERSGCSLFAEADWVILVLQADRVRREVARKAKEMLDAAGANILGTVMNKRRYPIPDFIYRRL